MAAQEEIVGHGTCQIRIGPFLIMEFPNAYCAELATVRGTATETSIRNAVRGYYQR